MKNILTTGIHDGHAFVIKDIARLAKTFVCVHPRGRFTKLCNLQRHAQRCAQGKTAIDSPAEKVKAAQKTFKKAVFPKNTASPKTLRWLEQEAKTQKLHIHHARRGHGGERWIDRAAVDGYDLKTKTIFQYHGCYWYGCLKYYHDRQKIIDRVDETREDLCRATVERTRALRRAGSGKSKKSCCSSTQETTPTRSYTISKHMRARISEKSRHPCSLLRTHTCRSRLASETPSNAIPHTSVKKTLRSWFASSWKSWSGEGKTSE